MPERELKILVWDYIPNKNDIREVKGRANREHFLGDQIRFDIDSQLASGEGETKKYSHFMHGAGVSLQLERNIDDNVLPSDRKVKIVLSGYKGHTDDSDLRDLKNKLDIAIIHHRPDIVVSSVTHGVKKREDETDEEFWRRYDRVNDRFLSAYNEVLKKRNVSMVNTLSNHRTTPKRFSSELQHSNILFVYSDDNMLYDTSGDNSSHTIRTPSIGNKQERIDFITERLTWWQKFFRNPENKIQIANGNSFNTPMWVGMITAMVANREKTLDQVFKIDLSIKHLFNSLRRDFKDGTLKFKTGTPKEVQDELLNASDMMNEYYRKSTGSAKFSPSDENMVKNIVESSSLNKETDFLDNFK